MRKLEKVSLNMENPNIRQRFVLLYANFLLWIVSKLFKDDQDEMVKEIADIVAEARKSL